MPSDARYDQVQRQCYRGLVFDPPSAVPDALHHKVEHALENMRRAELFHRDIVATGRSVSATFVERTLVGNPGMTYFYQRLRIFAHSWNDEHCAPGSPLRVIRQLNEQMKTQTKRHLKRDPTPIKGSCDYNITLINYMQSLEDANKSDIPLREEEIFGLGDASVSWHADSSLQDFSSIAVYQKTGDQSGQTWSIASRVIGDEITPAIKYNLKDGQTYYMLNDFNHHHHHAVLAGNTWRYSSTHRVAIVGKDTWDYAWRTAQEGQVAYDDVMQSVRSEKEISSTSMRAAAEAHLVIEFEWLQMYWMQGRKHAESHGAYWQPAMEKLWEVWSSYEKMLPIIAGYLLARGEQSNARSKRMYVWLLDELVEKRKELRKRCRAPVYLSLSEDEKPMNLPSSGVVHDIRDLRAALE